MPEFGSKINNTNIKINKIRKLSLNSLNNKRVSYKKSKIGLALYQNSNKIHSHHYSLAINKYNNNDVNSINNLSPHKRSNNSKKNVNSKFYEKHRKSMNNNNNNNTSNKNLISNDANVKENNKNNNSDKSKKKVEFIDNILNIPPVMVFNFGIFSL